MFKEKRVEPREQLAVPLRLAEGVTAITRDISAAGLFFVIEGRHVFSGPVDFEMVLPEMSLRFTSSGEIVRIEHEQDTTGVAVRFLNPHLDVLSEPASRRAPARKDRTQGATSDRREQTPAPKKRRGSE
jgi:hypothetical protein